jgi:hypothetical protein
MTITCVIRYEIDPFQHFAMAQSHRLILREERESVQGVDGTFGVPSTFKA